MALPSIVLAGHPYAPIGMGEHVRSAYRAWRAVGAKPSILDIYAMEKRRDADHVSEFGESIVRSLSPDINIFHINGDEIEQALAHLSDPNFERAYNIIYPAWELSRYPEVWARQLERFDEIWAPSQFIAEAIRGAVSKPVTHMSLPVEVRLSLLLGRRHFGIPEHAFVYLFFFDLSSYVDRKNPFAVLEAFLAMRPDHMVRPLHCVIKYKGEQAGGPVGEKLRAMIAEARGRIQMIDRDLSDNEVKNLVRCADAFVSLHRSEGYGRGIAEAMALGRIAIATRYSGNLDFMTEETAFGVDYKLIPVPDGAYPHAAGQVWADPNVEHATRQMELVAQNPSAGRKIAEQARIHMRVHHSARATGIRYSDRIRALRRSA